MKIISRYVLREHLGPLVFSMSALTSLLLLNYIAKQLPQLVGKGLPFNVIAEFIALSLPFTIALTLPMAVLVATLHAFSRLAADSEITAFKASGLALPRLMAPVVVSGLILSLIMVWFNDQVMPAANYTLQNLSNDIARKKPTFLLRPQVINEVRPQTLYLRASRIDKLTSDMRDVTIWDFSDAQRRRTIRAETGHVELSADGHDLMLTLGKGYSVELARAEMGRLQRVQFTRDFVRIRGIGNDLERNKAGAEKSDREKTVCELEDQLQAARHQRDSLFAALRRLDPGVARSVGNPVVRRGSGNVYCRLLRTLTVRSAHAAELQARDTTRKDTTVKVSPGMEEATRNPKLIAPSSGGADPNGQATPVLIESMKIQLSNAQRVIDGNQVEIEKKFAIATACVIFALLGAPVAFRFPRGGVGMTIGVSLAVFGVYYMGLNVGEDLARRNFLPPALAMWSTNLILLAIGVVLTARLGREGTTNRGSELSEQVVRWKDAIARRFGRAGTPA